MDQTIGPSHEARAWTMSGVLHAALVVGALLIPPLQSGPASQEPFRWEVVMDQAESSAESKPVEPSISSAPQPLEERAVERRAAPVVQAMPSVAQPLSTRTPVVQRRVSHGHEVIQREARHSERTIMEREIAAIPQEPSGVEKNVHTVPEFTKPAPVTASREVISTAVVDSPVPSSTPVSTPIPTTVETGEAVESTPMSQPASVGSLVEGPVATVHELNHPITKQIVEARPAHNTEPRMQGAATTQVPVMQRSGAQAHYGWLKDLLQGHIERMKQYPQLALDRKLEGRVVVRAVMWNDGTLTDLEVLHSSGHHILDDEALKLLTRLSPVSLTYDLGKESIMVKIPITYGIQ